VQSTKSEAYDYSIISVLLNVLSTATLKIVRYEELIASSDNLCERSPELLIV
jgi:hypothetical protein